MNALHPDVWIPVALRGLCQALKGYYALLFQLPWLPEIVLRANNFTLLRRFLVRSAHPHTFTHADVTRYIQAWSHPGTLTAMLNYYRVMRRKPSEPSGRVYPPTLVIWGMQDVFLQRRVAEAGLALCHHGQSLFLDTATHWVQLEAVEAVNIALARFFTHRHHNQ